MAQKRTALVRIANLTCPLTSSHTPSTHHTHERHDFLAATLLNNSATDLVSYRLFGNRLNTVMTVGAAHITYGWIECGQLSFALVGIACTTALIVSQWQFGPQRPWLSLWLAIWFTSHLLGMRYGLYGSSSLFDKAMHAIITGGFVVMWIDWIRPALAGSRLDPRHNPWSLLLLAVIFTLATAALWEIFEFGIDQTGMFRAQRGLDDTMLDMIAALAGGCLAWCWEAAASGRQQQRL